MKLTGLEILKIPYYPNPPRERALKHMTQLEVLAVANEAARTHRDELAAALYRWQWKMRQPKPRGPNHAA